MVATVLQTIRHFIGYNWAALAITLTCVSLGVWFALVLARYVGIALNLFLDTTAPLSPGPAAYGRIHGDTVRFHSLDGTPLAGMWLWAPDRRASRGTVVFLHEFGCDRYSCVRYARPLLRAGYNLFAFDFRNHGASTETEGYRPLQWASNRELADALGATAYVAQRLIDEGLPARLGLFGISRGAALAVLAAEADPNVRALICDGAFSTEAVCISMMKRWARIFARIRLAYENHPPFFWRMMAWAVIKRAQCRTGCRYPSVQRCLRRLRRTPIFFIHGRRDSYIDPALARVLHAAAAPPKRLWLVHGARHNQAAVVAPEAYARRTISFFDRYLADGPGVAKKRPRRAMAVGAGGR
ncbi:MAG: alpha/beta hydrolase [Planctomycetes bacterium]|nr:alpha/beta hydrolase [Planctomycetota bacterium]